MCVWVCVSVWVHVYVYIYIRMQILYIEYLHIEKYNLANKITFNSQKPTLKNVNGEEKIDK